MASPTGPIKTRVSKQGITGPRGLDARGVITAPFTIPAATTNSASFQLENNFFVNGETQSATINGIFGTLSKVSGSYIFKRKTAGIDVPVIAGTNVFFVVDPAESDNKNPLGIGGATISENNKDLTFDAKSLSLKNLFGFLKGSKAKGWIFSLRDNINQIAIGLKTNNIFYVQGLEIGGAAKVKSKTSKVEGWIISFRDSTNILISGLRPSGAVFINSLISNIAKIGDLQIKENYGREQSLLAFCDKDKKIIYQLKPSGTHEFSEIKTKSIVDNGALDFLKENFTISNFLAYLAATQTNTYILTGNGQSNSIGADGFLDSTSASFNGYLDTTQAYTGNVKLLDTGSAPLYDGTGDVLSLVALVEPLKPVRSLPNEPRYPGNIYGQSHASPIANEMSYKIPGWRSAFGLYGESGAGIANIKKGGVGNAWSKMIYEISAIKNLLVTANKSYKIGAHFLTHGEADWADVNYAANLIQYAKDLQDDLLPISGQKEPIPLILSQQGTFPFDYYNDGLISAQKQFEAARDSPLIYLSGPLYQRRYTTQQDVGSGVHRTAWDFRAEGIKYAQVAIAVACGIDWKPLQPNRIVQVDKNHIRIRFDVPFGALRFDPNITQPPKFHNLNADPNPVPNPWAAGKGFEIYGDGYNWDYQNNFIPINDCYLISNNEIEITIPNGFKPVFVAYAWMIFRPGGDLIPNPYAADYGIVTPGGRTRGRRGSLCDNDPWRGYDEVKLNCGVTAGSKTITITGNAFKPVGWYFRAHGAFLPEPTIVSTRVSDNQLILSESWSGATGTFPLIFHSDQSNYCIHFKLPVNYQS
jgi:hypothetical protein